MVAIPERNELNGFNINAAPVYIANKMKKIKQNKVHPLDHWADSQYKKWLKAKKDAAERPVIIQKILAEFGAYSTDDLRGLLKLVKRPLLMRKQTKK